MKSKKYEINDIELEITDLGSRRKVSIKGAHVLPRSKRNPKPNFNCQLSEIETELNIDTIILIAKKKGKYLRDEIERGENPNYMLKPLQKMVNLYEIKFNDKKVLDFGCGAGAFYLNLHNLGAHDIIGVDVDFELVEIAKNRLSDFQINNDKVVRIDYVNKNNRLYFADGEFDIVWAHAVLEHVFPNERIFVLAELWRVLKKDGIMIIDATPNRLWIKENHTTDLFFLNYLPLDLVIRIAKKYAQNIPQEQSKEIILSRGIRGCTYWSIKNNLSNSICVNNLQRKKELFLWMDNWRKESDSRLTKFIKEAYYYVMLSIDPILRYLNVPQTAFLPWLSLIFIKKK
ncbi:MAG: class I SAM-dependent methyltransferase [Stygiobacter sp.]|nr:MAG: class I SAM-dependent methyltransferase [Stygiobacter sp.]